MDKSTKFCIILVKLIVKPKPDLLKHILPVFMEQNYGIYLKITSSQSVLHGGKVLDLDAFSSFQTPLTQHSYQTYATHYHCWMFFYIRMLNFVHCCLLNESPLINFMAHHGIIYGQMDSVIGGNILNCSFRYNIRLEEILNSYFQSRDIYSHFYANSDSSILLGPLIELLQC